MGWLPFLLALVAGGFGGVVLMCLFFINREDRNHGATLYEPDGFTDLGKNLGNPISKSRQFSIIIED
jgi:hypothetical protein